MARVKRSVHAKKKRREVLEQAKGYRGLKKNSYKRAKEQVMKSLSYSYRDRRVRKRDFRRLWIIRINAGARGRAEGRHRRAGRRPPPQAARSGLDGGEHGASLRPGRGTADPAPAGDTT